MFPYFKLGVMINCASIWTIILHINTLTVITMPSDNYSGTPLVSPPLLHQESGLSRGVASTKPKG